MYADARGRRGRIRTVTTFWRGLYNEHRRPPRRVPRRGSESPLTPLELLFEEARSAGARLATGAASSLRGRLGLRRPASSRTSFKRSMGLSRFPICPFQRPDRRRERSRPVRHGPSARVRGRVLVGSGTMLASPAGTWLPERVFPPAAEEFAELRRPRATRIAYSRVRHCGRCLRPSASSARQSAIVFTTEGAAPDLRKRVPATVKSSQSTTANASTYCGPSLAFASAATHSSCRKAVQPCLASRSLGPCR